MTEDAVQLRQFVKAGDEEAFRKLVCRHFDLVYGTALRQTNGDASLAEDVAQAVFTDLARKAGGFPRHILLAGWLYQAVRFAAAKAVRTEQRRRIREQEAFSMQDPAHDSPPDWDQIRPVLDAAMGSLSRQDRNAVLLHYFEQKSFRAVGAALGLSDDAAQKRVSRALDKLRAILLRGGLAVSGSTLSSFLSAGLMPAAPAGVALSVARASLLKAAAAGPAGFYATLMQNLVSAKAKLSLACLLIALLGGAAALWFPGGHPVAHGEFVTVDLSAHYNGSLDKSWTSDYGDNYLAALGAGRRILKGVPFEIHGVVQLQGAEWKQRGYDFPDRIEGIRVGAAGSRIHLLHANSAFADPPGTVVASLILHYSDGDQTSFDIHEGIETLDWWGWPLAPIKQPTGTNTVVAWTGDNPPAQQQGVRIRLFDTIFVNPHPEKEIQSIDCASAMARSAPFLVALTLEH